MKLNQLKRENLLWPTPTTNSISKQQTTYLLVLPLVAFILKFRHISKIIEIETEI